ncbi:MAG: hypothetical protein KatS3mg124_0479 [Porticoccaceae bacterium]|nr:MAG: hypothetical protein KatS3mg124_0479 [Porticoccaceae bacterium]
MDTVLIALHGEQWVNLGAGNDWLEIWGDTDDILTTASGDGVSTVDAGDGNDYVQGRGDYLNYEVTLGVGDDTLELASCDWCAEGDNSVDAGGGNDLLTLAVIGYQTVDAGAGNDTLNVGCDCDEDLGELDVTMGDGNDVVTIWGRSFDTNADGTIDIDVSLGAGDDRLTWLGASGSLSLSNAVAIDAGEGDDWLTFTGDHRFDLDLGDGADTLEMQADHLEAQDTILMGDGDGDRIVLHNGQGADECDFGIYCGSASKGTVLTSETSNTRSVEVFDLRNGNIELHLTTGLFQTAFANHITVRTELSEHTPLPPLTYLGNDPNAVTAFSQGMTREDWESIVQDWSNGLYLEQAGYSADESGLLEYLFDNGIQAVDFLDNNDDGDGEVVTSPKEVDDPDVPSDDEDQVFFRVEDCEQTVDVTAVDFSLVPGWEFTLLGGNVRDVLVANDDFVSGNFSLRFDSAGSDADSVTDTLVVVGGADITDMDEEQISGLECIILRSDDLNPDVWQIDLTEAFVNQTTGSANLEIFVDTNVEAGSELRLYTDQLGNPSNGVVVHTNSNVTVYIDDMAVTAGTYAGGLITVVNELIFTENADNLVGTGGDDLFIALSADHVDGIDNANGGSGYDTLQLEFVASNPNLSLADQLDNPNITDIEVIQFMQPGSGFKGTSGDRTLLPVAMEGIGFPDVEELHTGEGADSLWDMEGGVLYETYGGDDVVDIDSSLDTTVIAGGGDDTVWAEAGEDSIDGGDGDDILWGGSGNDTILGGAGNDSIDGHSGDDNIVAGVGNDTVLGGSGADTIDGGSGDDYIDGEDGSDRITDLSGDNHIHGRSGDDTIITGAGNDSIWSESGDDSINAGDGDNYVDSSSGDDTIVTGAGADTIYAESGDDSVISGDGDDYIHLGWGVGADTVDAGGGDDYIELEYLSRLDLINGGDGIDTLHVGEGPGFQPGGQPNDYFGNAAGFGDLFDASFSGVSNVEVLDLFYEAHVNGDANFEASGIRTILTYSGGDDILDFFDVSSAADLFIASGSGDDRIVGGGGDDTIDAGAGADTVIGSTGGDQIDLGADSDADVVRYDRAEEGAQTGQNTGYDRVTNFVDDGDEIQIGGNLETAVDTDTDGAVDSTLNDAALDISANELAVYTNTSLSDADLVQSGFTNLLNYLNTNLAVAGVGDNVLYLVQGASDTALYFYQENTGDNIIDASEIKLLAVFDNALLEANDVAYVP